MTNTTDTKNITLFEKLKEIAYLNGFEILEELWMGADIIHKFRHIESGNMYETTPHRIQNKGFPQKVKSSDNDKYTELLEEALKNGFELLDAEWLGGTTKHTFKHIESGKTYQGTPKDLKRRGFPKDLRNNDDLLNEISALSKKNGFQLLDTIWLGSGTKHMFKHIDSGKIYEFLPRELKRRGFPKDLRSDNDMLSELSAHAAKNGFELLETKWLGSIKKHKFKNLLDGEIYEFAPNNIKHSFPSSINKTIADFNDLKLTALSHGFELLDENWNGCDTKHNFKHIESGHLYQWRPSDIKRKGFPKNKVFQNNTSRPVQYKTNKWQQVTIADKYKELCKYAKDNDFELLEEQWLGGRVKHRFKHIPSGKLYEQTPDDARHKGFPKKVRDPIASYNELSQFALKNGFDLLETKWLGANVKHRFKHLNSGTIHEWMPAQLMYKQRGFPSIQGQRYITEEICRQVMSHLFGGTFKSNLNRLKEQHGKNIQLDGFEKFDNVPDILSSCGKILTINGATYDQQLKPLEIAFEYQGHENHRHNKAVILRDMLRVQYCKNANIVLIVIDPPQNSNRIRDSNYMFDHVCSTIQHALTTEKPLKFKPEFKIDISNYFPDIESFNKLKTFAQINGFELLETQWLGYKELHSFKHLASGKLYKGSPDVMNRGFPKDLRTTIDMYNELCAAAKQNGTEVLENKWLGSNKMHKFKHIDSGIIYERKPQDVMHRGFPKDLRTDEDKLNTLYTYAETHGFELLDTYWKGTAYKHQFKHIESGETHEWTPNNIMRRGFPKSITKTLDQKIGELFFDNIPPAETFMPKTTSSNMTALEIEIPEPTLD